jgi:MFS family permease
LKYIFFQPEFTVQLPAGLTGTVCVEKMSTNTTTSWLDNARVILRSLRHRNYRLFFIGQGTSLVGTWMQSVAMNWLAYRMTNSPFFLGIVAFAGQIPTFVIAPFAGVIADRLSRHRIVIATQICSMIQAMILTLLVYTGHVAPWHLVVLSVVLGLINGFDIPTRQAFVYELVDLPEDLPNAIALNSFIFNGARLVGPSIAGLVIYASGEWPCFLLNAVSYLAVLVALWMMRLKKRNVPSHNGPALVGLKEGVIYAWRFVPIRMLLLLLSFISIFGMSHAVLMPVFAKDILGGGPHTLGFLLGAVGIGAISGAIYLASRKSIRGLGRIIVIGILALGFGVIAFSFSTRLWLSLIFILVVGFGMMIQMASINTLLQTLVDDDKRGRVMSLYTMSFMGMAPFGSLIAGSAATHIGAPNTIRISGVLSLVAAIVFLKKLPELRKHIHPIYVQKGIIPQIAEGLGSTTPLTLDTKE